MDILIYTHIYIYVIYMCIMDFGSEFVDNMVSGPSGIERDPYLVQPSPVENRLSSSSVASVIFHS